VLVADKLFATLETTVRAIEPPTRPKILVSDTVGFIHKLPHDLVASFKSTLDEALEASLLLHVVDVSDPAHEHELAVTEEVLGEIGAGEVPRLLIFNKLDRVADQAAARARIAARWPGAVAMSAVRPDDIAALRQRLVDHFAAQMEEREIFVPYAQQAKRSAIFESCQVLGERYDEHGVVFHVRAPRGLSL
jgi:GTP-binding protein HflX